MGIKGLWKAFGDGESMYLADFSTRFYLQHGRYPRIAVDEIGWWFTNVSHEQEADIQGRQSAAHPIKKTNVFRAMNLAKWHIEPIFVFDGDNRPKKRNGTGGGRIDPNTTALIKSSLTELGIPWHVAPGEAEAECAALQKHGIVDAVWTADGDAFMFGATCVLRPLIERQDKLVDDKIRVYHMSNIEAKLGLNHSSMVLLAVLAGGDYYTSGLPNCGWKKTLKLADKKTGLAQGLLTATASSISAWRDFSCPGIQAACAINLP